MEANVQNPTHRQTSHSIDPMQTSPVLDTGMDLLQVIHEMFNRWDHRLDEFNSHLDAKYEKKSDFIDNSLLILCV